MDFKYSEPKAFSSEICEKINECFIDLNLTQNTAILLIDQ